MPRHSDNPMTEQLHVRFTPAELRALRAVAKGEYLKPSPWARQVLLRAVKAAQQEQREDGAHKGNA